MLFDQAKKGPKEIFIQLPSIHNTEDNSVLILLIKRLLVGIERLLIGPIVPVLRP